MKWLIASDIHGSAYYCEKLMRTKEREACDRMILLGDLLYHGPRNDLPRDYAPKQVIAMLNANAREILCVRGNCEAEVDQMVLDFPVLAEYALLPLEERLVFLTHGHIFHADHLPPLKEGDILLHGHTHIAGHTLSNGVHILNPGSVSIPKEDSPRAYMTLADGIFQWKTLEGEVFLSYKAE